MDVANIINSSQELAKEHSAAILTGIAVTGTITTAVLTGRATVKAIDILEGHKYTHEGEEISYRELPLKTKAKLVWPQFVPPVGMGAVTISAVIMANRIPTRKAAALAAVYGISEKAFQEYKDKVVEQIGQAKELKVRDAIAEDRIKHNPVNTREVIIAGTGEVLCMDMLSGRYFQSSVEEIKKAENKTNFDIINHSYASLSSFYDEIGLPPTMFSDEVGFNLDNRCEVNFSTQLSVDDRPCVAISFAVGPVADYNRIY